MDNLLLQIKDCLRSAGLLEIAEFYKGLAGLTSIGTGGKCLCFIRIRSRSKLTELVGSFIKKGIEFIVIGSGTNILFGDGMHRITVLQLEGELSSLEFGNGCLIRAGSGYNLQKFVVTTARNGFDFSFLGGIPGTVGGAVMGNSGIADTAINEYVKSMDYLPAAGTKVEEKHLDLKPEDIQYRSLHIDNMSIITYVVLEGKKTDSEDIFKAIRDRIKQKKARQPTNSKNAGCFFKNPVWTGRTAGELIDACGFKGFCYGGARVSKKHANFIENFADASSKDIYLLSKIIRDEVRVKHGIELEYEVKLVGINE